MPILTAPKRHAKLKLGCDHVRSEMNRLEALLPHLNAQTARRHVVVLSKEHSELQRFNCSGWFYRPQGLLVHAMRVAYSHPQPPELRSTAYWCDDISRSWFEDPYGEFPNAFSVPFPSSIHAAGGNSRLASSARPPWDTSAPRRLQMNFIGQADHGDPETRQRVVAQCKRLGKRRCSVSGFATGGGLQIKHDSDFCLEPQGDSPFRKSLADSIGMGCIPILFHPMTDNANALLWEGWKQASRVLIPYCLLYTSPSPRDS